MQLMRYDPGQVPFWAKNLSSLRRRSFGLGSKAASKYGILVWFWTLALRAK